MRPRIDPKAGAPRARRGARADPGASFGDLLPSRAALAALATSAMHPDPRALTPQGSHWPTLEACIAHTSGPVLELGCGRESTRQLHALCAGRILVSLDNNEQFVEEFADLRSETHQIRHADYATSPLLDQAWDVALVDEAPASSRTVSIRRLARRARIIVAHDTEPAGEQVYLWNEIWAEFRHYKHVAPEGLPRTTVMSNTDDLGFLP